MARQIGETLFFITLVWGLLQEIWTVLLALVFLGCGRWVQGMIDGRRKNTQVK